MEEILVDEFGYQQFFEELDRLRNLLSDNAKEGNDAYKSAVGDGWHDNFEYEQSQRKEKMINANIQKMLKEKKYIKVISKEKISDDVINIGDQLKLSMKSEGGEEIIDVILTGKYLPDFNNNEISLNSPLGKCLYLKKTSDKFNYIVNEKVINIIILDYKKKELI